MKRCGVSVTQKRWRGSTFMPTRRGSLGRHLATGAPIQRARTARPRDPAAGVSLARKRGAGALLGEGFFAFQMIHL